MVNIDFPFFPWESLIRFFERVYTSALGVYYYVILMFQRPLVDLIPGGWDNLLLDFLQRSLDLLEDLFGLDFPFTFSDMTMLDLMFGLGLIILLPLTLWKFIKSLIF